MLSYLSEMTVQQFINTISDQHFVMTGTVLAASAAQAAALGEACMQISLDNQVDKLDWQDITARISQMSHIKTTLTEWSNQEIGAGMAYVDMQAGPDLASSRHALCDYAAEVSQLTVQAIILLQDFRDLAVNMVRADMEMAIHLLTSIARTALLLLASCLRRWPDSALLKEFEPIRAELEGRIAHLMPVNLPER